MLVADPQKLWVRTTYPLILLQVHLKKKTYDFKHFIKINFQYSQRRYETILAPLTHSNSNAKSYGKCKKYFEFPIN